MRVDTLMQLPEDKRPPRGIWGDEKRLEEFLDRVSDPKKKTEFELYIDEDEIEGL